MNSAQQIIELYRKHGHQEYGERCNMLSHSVQSGLIARDKGFDAELILSAFLHDVGHLSPIDQEESYEEMGGLGIDAHDMWGEQYLETFGFSPRIIEPVKNHVASKRYLCYADHEYYNQLSDASKGTMEYQGGVMSKEEAEAFEKVPYFEESILIRKIDDEAKERDFVVTEEHFNYFESLISNYFNH